jgi:ABC-2 type transport system ATP-binding protein
MHEFIDNASSGAVVVVSPDAGRLAPVLAAPGVTFSSRGPGRLEVLGLTAAEIGDAAAQHGLRLHALSPVSASLETAYLELTRNAVEYAGGTSTTVHDQHRRAA